LNAEAAHWSIERTWHEREILILSLDTVSRFVLPVW